MNDRILSQHQQQRTHSYRNTSVKLAEMYGQEYFIKRASQNFPMTGPSKDSLDFMSDE
jgi:hypothetical protein